MSVLDALRLPNTRENKFCREIETALNLIDGVLKLPELPVIQVHFTHSERFGGYTAGSEVNPPTIELSVFGITPRLTASHEVGHFLDDAIGEFQEYASLISNSQIEHILLVSEESAAIQAFREYARQTESTLSPKRFRVLNRLNPEEIWARAFAQYIALRSKDAKMLAEVELRREIEAGVLQNEQWEWDDFTSIGQAIDTELRSMGWLP